MKTILGVISDTHMYKADKELEFLNEIVFKNASKIIHCGDLVSLNVLDGFSNKKVIAVSGNMDGSNVRNVYPFIEKITVSGVNFLILHGNGYYSNFFNSLQNEFPDFNVFLYGHTHKPLINKIGKNIFFNPGSFSYNRVKDPSRSAGLIEIEDEKAVFKIIDLSKISQKKFTIKEVLDVRHNKGNFF
ncbi:MAG: metallophosphoesterase [Desulforegulaceae bacterium]|nr:metallophosphoesterase [Desulforegulaceae bacterium]